jgi:predicted metalloprotease with PDZ domain
MNIAPHTTIRIVEPTAHLIDVSISVLSTSTTVTLRMPVWTPGSYMVREYARHVRDVRATVGDVLVPITKIDKRSWVSPCQPGDVVTVHYRVYAYDLTVRTNHVDDTHAFFNPAAVVMQLDVYSGNLPLTVEAPHDWAVATQLDVVQKTALDGDLTRWEYVASDYDALYDAPFEIGTHRSAQFVIAGVLHEVVIWGSGNEDWPALVRDIERCTRAVQAHFRTIPYSRYTYILHLADGAYGGLEHCNSTVCLVDRWGFKRPRDYEKILGLITHEFYHTWNVKRIRPAPLGPFAYGTENYTRMLWLAEGVTSYYDNLIMCRAGIISQTRYLELLADDMRTVRRHLGSAVQSLSDASFDAWIRFYRPDENSNNVSVSYYIKGAVAAFLLDMHIRRWSDGTRSLDDVMHLLEQRYRLDAPGIPEDDTMQALIAEVVGGHRAAVDLFFAQVINGTEHLEYSAACATVGLTDAWFSGDDSPCTIGITLRQEQQRCIITQVRSGSAAEAAGLAPFDELVALDGSRIDSTRWKARMAEYQPGTMVTLHTFRRDELRITNVQLETAPLDKMELRSVPHPSDIQASHYTHWLRMPNDTKG